MNAQKSIRNFAPKGLHTALLGGFVAGALLLSGCGGSDGGLDDERASSERSLSASAAVIGATSGDAPFTVMFNAGGSKGRITSYQWSFNDNTPVASDPVVAHTYREPGIYTVQLKVTDMFGNVRYANTRVTVTGTAVNPSAPNVDAGAVCSSAPAQFTTVVWPSLRRSCTACHTVGQAAGGTGLVFALGGSDVQNYNQLRTYARANGDLLLSKSIGSPAHQGGSPYVNNQSQSYRDLAALLPVMQQACESTDAGEPPVVNSAFWDGVAFRDSFGTLRQAAMMFASRNPTATEFEAVAVGGKPALRNTIRSYMQGPAFEDFLNEVGDTHFLTPGVLVFGGGVGLDAADYPSLSDLINGANGFDGSVRTRFRNSVRRENVELMKYIVKNDKPWTDMVAGDYTVMNGVIARYMAATVQGPFNNVDDDNEWRPGTWRSERLGGTRTHAGVLSSHAWLERFPTTDTNRNRHRVFMMAKQFLGVDMTALAARPVDDGAGNFTVPWIENPACAVCHDIIDPMAAGFQNWNERNRYLPNRDSTGVDHALPSTYRATSYPRNASGERYYRVGDGWFRDSVTPGYLGAPMPGGYAGHKTALQWLGQKVATDARFAKGAVHFWYQGLFGREPLKVPTDESSPLYAAQLAAYTAQQAEFEEIAQRFKTNRGTGAYNIRDLLVDMVMSRWFTAQAAPNMNAARALELTDVGSVNMITPAHLQRKLIALTGIGYSGFNNPLSGEALNYGDFDGVSRTQRAKAYTMMQTTTIDRVAASLSCRIVANDFNKPVSSRMLFPVVSLGDTPATQAGANAIVQNIKHLHQWMLKEDLPSTDAEIQRTYQLYLDVWNDRATAPAKPITCAYNNTNDPNYSGRAWAAIIAYMIGDPKFLFE